MNSDKKVSVVITTYNRAAKLSRAINSVLRQTYQNLNLLIIDDGSTDNTAAVVNDFIKKDGRISYFSLPTNLGLTKARNKGIRLSQGEFIAFLDSDDEWLPLKLEKQLELFKASGPDLGFIGCNGIAINESNNGIERYIKLPNYQKKDLLNGILSCYFMGSESGKIYRRSCFEKVGFFDENFRKTCEDWDMAIRLIEAGYNFTHVNKNLFYYYVSGDNITIKTSLAELQNDYKLLLKKYWYYYAKDKKIYSNRLRADGNFYTLIGGDIVLGRKLFWQAIRVCPANFKVYPHILFALLGIKSYRLAAWFKGVILPGLISGFNA